MAEWQALAGPDPCGQNVPLEPGGQGRLRSATPRRAGSRESGAGSRESAAFFPGMGTDTCGAGRTCHAGPSGSARTTDGPAADGRPACSAVHRPERPAYPPGPAAAQQGYPDQTYSAAGYPAGQGYPPAGQNPAALTLVPKLQLLLSKAIRLGSSTRPANNTRPAKFMRPSQPTRPGRARLPRRTGASVSAGPDIPARSRSRLPPDARLSGRRDRWLRGRRRDNLTAARSSSGLPRLSPGPAPGLSRRARLSRGRPEPRLSNS